MRSVPMLSWRAIQVIAGGLGVMYLVSGYQFITTHSISFISYTGASAQEIWTIRNLGIRILAIGIGLLVALASRRKDLLLLLLLLRLLADLGDCANSALTPGIDGSVARTLALFCTVESLSVGGLLWLWLSEHRASASDSPKQVAP